jgi:hypothetical protein
MAPSCKGAGPAKRPKGGPEAGDAQEMQRVRALEIPRESIAGHALGVGRTLFLERLYAMAQNIVDRSRPAVAAP